MRRCVAVSLLLYDSRAVRYHIWQWSYSGFACQLLNFWPCPSFAQGHFLIGLSNCAGMMFCWCSFYRYLWPCYLSFCHLGVSVLQQFSSLNKMTGLCVWEKKIMGASNSLHSRFKENIAKIWLEYFCLIILFARDMWPYCALRYLTNWTNLWYIWRIDKLCSYLAL